MNDPCIFLPANLAGLARCAGHETARFALIGVCVELHQDGYQAVATDCRMLAIISGPSAADPLTYPQVPELAELPPSADAAVIPRKDWQEMFRRVPRRNPGADCVAVHLGEKESVLVVHDGEQAEVRHVTNVEGRYPDYRAVLPSKEPVVRIHVNPEYLLTLVQLAKDLLTGDDNPRVTLEVHGPDVPLVLRCAKDRQQFTALLMPMT